MALKRAGRGQDPLGVEGTGQGELAVECPACPHPGCNLPDNWREAENMLYVDSRLLNRKVTILIILQISIYFIYCCRRQFQIKREESWAQRCRVDARLGIFCSGS